MLLAVAWLLGLMCASGVPIGWASAAGLVSLAIGTAFAALGFVRLDSDSIHAAPAQARGRWRPRVQALVLLSATWLAGSAVGPPHVLERWPPAGLATLELEVLETQRNVDGTARSLARVISGHRIADRRAIERGVLLRVGPVALRVGTRVRLPAQLSPIVELRNPSPHPPWPRARVIAGRAWITDAKAIAILDQGSMRATLDRLRTHVLERLIATLPARTAGIAGALVLGEGDAVEDGDQATIRNAGLSHVLAVSGMHVTLLVGLLVLGMRAALLRVPRLAARFEAQRIACALGAPLALVYAAFAGGAPSAWRAAVTATIAWTLVAFGRRPNAASVTAFAVLVLGAFDPREALRPGFLLSVLATAVIVAAPRPDATVRAHAAFALRIAAATTLATAPLVLWCFGQLPIVGVLANLVLVPIGSCALLPLASVHACLASVGFESAFTARLLTSSCDGFLNACAAFAQLGPQWILPPLDVAQAIALCLGIAALLLIRSARQALLATCVTALAIGALELRLRHRERPTASLRVTFLDVGQGDAALIDLPDGRLMLVDAGGNPGGGIDPGQAVLVPLLQARRRERVDIAVLTHPHPDHYGGMRALFDHVPVSELWDSGQAEAERDLEPGSQEASALLATLRTRGTVVRGPSTLCHAPLRAAGATVRVLAPCPAYDSTHDANDNSLVLRIDYGATSFLLMGDAEQAEESALVDAHALARTDVLKVGHHGSRTSTHEALLAAVRPSAAVISAGAANRFGHPHAEVLQRLQDATPHVLELAKTGGTIMTSDGKRIAVEPYAGASFEIVPAHTAR